MNAREKTRRLDMGFVLADMLIQTYLLHVVDLRCIIDGLFMFHSII